MDTYVECLVARKRNTLMTFLKVLAIIVAVLGFLYGSTISFIGIIVFIAAGLGAYFAHLNSKIEYEYLYVDKQITIDRIMARSSRKKVETLDLSKIEIMAPMKSWHLDNFKNRQVEKEIDYSSGIEQKPEVRYAVYYEGNKKYILEPNQEMVAALRQVAPRKVFND